MLLPLIVREAAHDYELIGGHRRLAAIQHLRGLDAERLRKQHLVAVIVHTADDERALLLARQENLQRQDLSRDQARYLELYVRKYGGVRKAAEVLKLSHTCVGQRCRVFADDVLAGPVMANQLDFSSAQKLLRVIDPDLRGRLVEQALAGDWSRLRIRQEVDKWNVDIPCQAGRVRADGKMEAICHELESISPRELHFRGAARRRPTVRRLMWMLGATAGAPEKVDAGDAASGPRIVSWVVAPA